MSNIVSLDAKVPAHLANRIGKPSALAEKLVGGISNGETWPRISIKGGRFRIKEGDAETVLQTTTIDVVIVGSNPRLSKTFYAKAWDPNAEPTAPDCSSMDGVRPDANVSEPQNDLCATCPHNAWGSKKGPQGQDLKACSDSKRIAVVSADDPSGPVYLMLVTPAALKDLNQYQKDLSHRGIAPELVRTRIGFDTNASFPKIKFGFGGWLTEDEITAVDEVLANPVIPEMTGEKARPAPAQIEAPAKPKPQLVKPAPAPAPAEEEEAPAPAAAPKRGFGAKAEAAAPAKPAAAPKAAAKPKAAPVPEANASLEDEIAAMLQDAPNDDADA
jgi:hypothetical protein